MLPHTDHGPIEPVAGSGACSCEPMLRNSLIYVLRKGTIRIHVDHPGVITGESYLMTIHLNRILPIFFQPSLRMKTSVHNTSRDRGSDMHVSLHDHAYDCSRT